MRYDERVTKNPLYNAILAAGYIALVATIMNYAEKSDLPEMGVLVPIAILSLFVLSAAVMGSIFFYQPAQMYLDGEKKEAINLFLKTLGFFACITVALLALLFFSSVSL